MANKNVYGSSNRVNIIDDTGSAVVHELTDQLNKAGYATTKVDNEVTGLGTGRVLLGVWKYDVYLRNILFFGDDGNALANGDTDAFIKSAPLSSFDLSADPSDAVTHLSLEGLTFKVKMAKWADALVEGTDVVSISGSTKGIRIPAGSYAYLAFNNQEGAVARTISVLFDVALTDFIELQPDGLQRNVHQQVRDQRRARRRAADQ